jgi:hypothetical protein
VRCDCAQGRADGAVGSSGAETDGAERRRGVTREHEEGGFRRFRWRVAVVFYRFCGEDFDGFESLQHAHEAYDWAQDAAFAAA